MSQLVNFESVYQLARCYIELHLLLCLQVVHSPRCPRFMKTAASARTCRTRQEIVGANQPGTRTAVPLSCAWSILGR